MTKVLFLVQHSLYPPKSGAALRNWQNISLISKFADVATVQLATRDAREVHSELPSKGALTVLSSGSSKIKGHRRLKMQLHRLMWLLGCAPFAPNEFYSSALGSELRKQIAWFAPDIIVFESLWLHPYLTYAKNGYSKTIYDAHNAEAYLSKQLSTGSRNGLWRKIRGSFTDFWVEAVERDFLQRADQVWVCSEQDAEILARLAGQTVGKSKIRVIANGIDIGSYHVPVLDAVPPAACGKSRPASARPRRLLFVGSFGYRPNALAAEQLLSHIYPRLRRQFPDCIAMFVGREPTKSLCHAARIDPNIVVTGEVPDTRPYFRSADVLAIPLQQGSGTRLKIIEAFATGCPVISTSKGAEGLEVRHKEHLLIADTPEEFVECISLVWSDETMARKLSSAASKLVKEKYSWEAICAELSDAIGAVRPQTSRVAEKDDEYRTDSIHESHPSLGSGHGISARSNDANDGSNPSVAYPDER